MMFSENVKHRMSLPARAMLTQRSRRTTSLSSVSESCLLRDGAVGATEDAGKKLGCLDATSDSNLRLRVWRGGLLGMNGRRHCMRGWSLRPLMQDGGEEERDKCLLLLLLLRRRTTDMTNSDSSSAWILTEFTHARMRAELSRVPRNGTPSGTVAHSKESSASAVSRRRDSDSALGHSERCEIALPPPVSRPLPGGQSRSHLKEEI